MQISVVPKTNIFCTVNEDKGESVTANKGYNKTNKQV